jgi:hypothetical protein
MPARNRLGPKDDIAEHVGLRRIQGIAYREAGIPPIASEGVVHGCDLPGLLLSRCDDGDLAAGPARVLVRSRRQAKQRPRLADFDCPFGSDLQLFDRDGQPFGVAGIWENWREPPTDKWERRFSLSARPTKGFPTD